MSDERRAGRPSKLTPEVVEKVLYAIGKGNYRCVAAQFAGISEKTFKEWMSKGDDDPDTDYGRFRAAVLDAEARVEIEAVGVLSDASAKDPKRLVDYLSRKAPERWASDQYKVRQLEKELAEIKRLLSEHLQPGLADAATASLEGPAAEPATQPERLP